MCQPRVPTALRCPMPTVCSNTATGVVLAMPTTSTIGQDTTRADARRGRRLSVVRPDVPHPGRVHSVRSRIAVCRWGGPPLLVSPVRRFSASSADVGGLSAASGLDRGEDGFVKVLQPVVAERGRASDERVQLVGVGVSPAGKSCRRLQGSAAAFQPPVFPQDTIPPD